MKLMEAFDAMDVAAEARIVELAQMLAERFPKPVNGDVEEAQKSGLRDMFPARPLSQGSVQVM
jgi:hypothetical protein